MSRLARLAVLVVGLVVGYGLAVALSAPVVVDPSATPLPGVKAEVVTTTTAEWTTTSSQPPSTTSVPSATTYLVWSSGGLTEGLVEGLEETFDELSIVLGDLAPLAADKSNVVPLDGLGIDPTSHRPFDPGRSLAVLSPGGVVLSESSAIYRGLSAGSQVNVAGHPFEVLGVVPDDVVAAAEIVFLKDDPNSPATVPRYALIRSELSRTDFEELVRAMNDGPAPLRIRAEGESLWMRHGDAVLPHVFIKMALGEFSYPPSSGSSISPDAAFLAENIVTARVPVLGTITCHRIVVEMVTGAMEQLSEEGLSHLVDPGDFAGCYNARLIRTVTGEPAGVSRHSWGAALDINAGSNGLGVEGDQDPRLVEIMEEWGFIWGGDWAVPDPMHFEYGVLPP